MSNEKLIKGSQIDSNQIESGHLKNNSVTEQKISDGSVTANKIADGGVTNSKINTVNGSKLVDDSVTEAKLATAVQTKLNSATASEISMGDATELFGVGSSIKYSENTSDLYTDSTPANNFWHPSYSVAAFSTGSQPLGYNDADVVTTLTNTTNKQFYFVKDINITAANISNAYGMYFNFRCAFKGMIWVNGTEAFNNLDASDDGTKYTTKAGHTIVCVQGAQDYITTGIANRIAIVYKQTSGQSSLDFGVNFGMITGGTQVVGLESFGFSFDMDNIQQGSAYNKISAAEYATLSRIPSAAEAVFLTSTKSSSYANGGVVFGDDLSSYASLTAFAADGGAALIGFDDSGFGFSASTVQAAIAGVVNNISSSITFDNTTPSIKGLDSTPTMQQGFNKLGYAANINIDSTHFTALGTGNYYIQNALNYLRYASGISFTSTGLGITGDPATVQALGTALADPDNISYAYAGKMTATKLGPFVKELRDKMDDATNIGYSGSVAGSNVKHALDNLSVTASNEMYSYDGNNDFSDVRTAFGALGETLPSDFDSTQYALSVPIDFLMSAMYQVQQGVLPHAKFCDTYSVVAPDSAEDVSNDYTSPGEASWGEIEIDNIYDTSNELWENISAVLDRTTGQMDIVHKLSGGSGVVAGIVEGTNEYSTSVHAPEDFVVSDFVLKVLDNQFTVACQVDQGKSSRINVRYGP